MKLFRKEVSSDCHCPQFAACEESSRQKTPAALAEMSGAAQQHELVNSINLLLACQGFLQFYQLN
jgi:hypothetical protein